MMSVNVKSIRNTSYLFLIFAVVGLLVAYSGVFHPAFASIFASAFILLGSLSGLFHAVLSKMDSKIDGLEQQIRLIRENA
jgi:hypothetical protein